MTDGFVSRRALIGAGVVAASGVEVSFAESAGRLVPGRRILVPDTVRKGLAAMIGAPLPRALTFDDELYLNIFRLNGREFTASSIKKRPGVVGKWTNDFYERLAPGVLAEIRRTVPRDEKDRPKVRYHHMLTDHLGHSSTTIAYSGGFSDARTMPRLGVAVAIVTNPI